MAPRRRDWLVGSALVAAVFATYAPVVQNGFVSFDDDAYITGNPAVTGGLSWQALRWAFTEGVSDNWHPLTWLSHMLDCQLFGLDAAGHHLMSVALHAANAALLFAALRMLTGAFWSCALVAALFALRVESVAWAAERKDVLSGLFFMLSLVAYARWALARSRFAYAALLCTTALGLMAKPMLVILPFLLLLLDAWPLDRLRAGPAGAAWQRAVLLEKLPILLMAALAALATLTIQLGTGTAQSLEAIPVLDRVANALISYVAYLWQSLWPVGLTFFYPHPSLVGTDSASVVAGQALAALLALAAISAGAVAQRKRRPYLLFGWLWYAIALLPVIGLVQVGSQARADRYTYLPMIGIYIAVVWAGRDALARAADPTRGRRVRLGLAGLSGSVLVLLGVAASGQVAHWRDDFHLYGHALRVTERNYVAHNNLGAAFAKRGDFDRAAEHYRAALSIKPDHVESLNNLALVLSEQGRTDEAAALLEQALALRPENSRLHVNLGTMRTEQARLEEAIAHWERALDLVRPGERVALYANLAGAERLLGDRNASAHHYAAALALDPGSAPNHHLYGLLLAEMGDRASAVHHQRKAVELEPGLLPAAEALARLLLDLGTPADLAEAQRLAELCVRAAGERNPRQLALLAAVYAARGDYVQAHRWQRKAVAFTPAAERAAPRALLDRYAAEQAGGSALE